MRAAAVTRQVTIRNRLGLHARAAARRFRAEITVESGGRRVNGKSIMGLLLLAAAPGTSLTLEAVGEDGPAALEALAEIVAGRFGERE